MNESLRTARLTAQLLSGPPAGRAEAVAERLLAIQAQDAHGARLAVRSRSVGLASADVDAALTDRRSLVIAWLNRGTLHLVTPDDYWWLHPLTTPQLATSNRTRLRQEGVEATQADRGVEIVMDAVHTHGPQTRLELRDRLDAAGVPTAGQALIHILFAASIRDDLVRGPMRGAHHAFVAASDWLGPPPPALDRPEALAQLARRYLAGHAPADDRDLAKWAGITLADARIAFDGCGDLVSEVPAPLPAPKLLGAFEPVLIGWKSRELFVGEHAVVATVNGIFRPCALVDGRVVGTWGLSGRTLTIRLLEPVPPGKVKGLRTDAADVFRFLGLPAESEVAVETA